MTDSDNQYPVKNFLELSANAFWGDDDRQEYLCWSYDLWHTTSIRPTIRLIHAHAFSRVLRKELWADRHPGLSFVEMSYNSASLEIHADSRPVDQDETIDRRDFTDKLPPMDRQIVTLAREGHTATEVARLLGVNDSTICRRAESLGHQWQMFSRN